MKIIYFFERRYVYLHDEEYFSYKSFEKPGVELEIWTSVRWQSGDRLLGMDTPFNLDASERVHYIDGMNDLLYNLKRIKNERCFFLMYSYHGYNGIGYEIRKEIKKSGFEFANLTESPTIENAPLWKTVVFSKYLVWIVEGYRFLKVIWECIYWLGCKRNAKREVAARIKDMSCRFWGPYNVSSKFNFITGNAALNTLPNALEIYFKGGKNIVLNANSYNEFLKAGSLMGLDVPDRYVVYIDQGMARKEMSFNRELTDGEWDTKKYLEQLERLFSVIENNYKCPVIIAAHPKSNYNGEEFNGRKVLFYQTPSLIKNACLVIIHTSTTWGLITLFQKPFLNIYNHEGRRRDFPIYQNIKQLFDCPQLDIEDIDKVIHFENFIKHYDKKRYDDYLERFVYGSVGDNQKKNSFDIIADMVFNYLSNQ